MEVRGKKALSMAARFLDSLAKRMELLFTETDGV